MRIVRFIVLLLATLWCATPGVRAVTLDWDTITGAFSSGPQGGTGNWLATDFWWNGRSNVQWVSGSAASFGPSAGTVTVNSAVTADSLSFSTSGYTINGSSTLTLSGSDTIEVNSGDTATISAPVGGIGGFTKSGAGTLSFTGSDANTITFITATVADGTLNLSKTAGVRAVGNLTIGDGIGAAASAIVTQGADEQIALAAADTASVTVNSDGFWKLFSLFGNHSETIGALSMAGGTVATGMGTLTVNGNITNTSATTSTISGQLNLGGDQSVIIIYSGTLSNSAIISNGGITSSGAGILRLSGANTFTGVVWIEGDGTVQVADVADSGASSHLGAGSSIIFRSGTLQFTGADDSTNRGVTLQTGGGTIAVTNAATTLTMAGPFSGAGGMTKSGAGTLALTGANSHAGNTSVQAGKLRLSMATLADAADVYLTNDATLDLTFTGADTIHLLFFNGISQYIGTWGAIGSGAEFSSSLITGTGRLHVTVGPLAGDFNGNGVVDAADYVVWRKGLGATYTQSDYDTWRIHFGQSAGSGSGATTLVSVPEPTAFLILSPGYAYFLVRRRRRP